MNTAKLEARTAFLDKVDTDPKVDAAFRALVEELTIIVRRGHGPTAKIQELKPLLEGLKRRGANPEVAVNLAIIAAYQKGNS